MNRIGRATGRAGGLVRNLRGRRGAGFYPARDCGFRGPGGGATMYQGDSNK